MSGVTARVPVVVVAGNWLRRWYRTAERDRVIPKPLG